MACHLLVNGWSAEEINARLGHSLTSMELEKYITALALDRHAPKKKLDDSRKAKTDRRLDEYRQKEKLYLDRLKKSDEEMELVKFQLQRQRDELQVIRILVEGLRANSKMVVV